MKRCICVFLMLLLLLCGTAPAESAVGSGSAAVRLNDSWTICPFDPDPVYSNYEQGSYAASFYTVSEDGSSLELMLLIPDTMTAGTTIRSSELPADTVNCGLMLSAFDAARNEIYIAAMFSAGSEYPVGSSFELTLTELTLTEQTVYMSGSFTAVALSAAENASSTETYPLEGEFSFTMSLAGTSSTPSATDAPRSDAPRSTQEPAPEQPSETPAPDPYSHYHAIDDQPHRI